MSEGQYLLTEMGSARLQKEPRSGAIIYISFVFPFDRPRSSLVSWNHLVMKRGPRANVALGGSGVGGQVGSTEGIVGSRCFSLAAPPASTG